VYDDDEEEHVVEGEQLQEPLSLSLQMAPGDGKPAVDAAAIIRRIKEEQGNNDSPSKRLDVLAGWSFATGQPAQTTPYCRDPWRAEPMEGRDGEHEGGGGGGQIPPFSPRTGRSF
jgi:hypothetical protein